MSNEYLSLYTNLLQNSYRYEVVCSSINATNEKTYNYFSNQDVGMTNRGFGMSAIGGKNESFGSASKDKPY